MILFHHGGTRIAELGINFIDIANAYGRCVAESFLGEVCRPASRFVRTRDQGVLSDERDRQGLSRKLILEHKGRNLSPAECTVLR